MPLPITKGLGSDGETASTLLVTQGYGGLGACGCGDTFEALGVAATPIFIDVSFNLPVAPLTLQAALPSNWTFTTAGPTQIVATGLLVIGDIVRVYITEPREGDTYTLTLPINGLKAINDAIYNGAPTIDFIAVAMDPVIAMAQAIDARHVRVIFSEPVIESDALTVTNYTITGPVLAVYAVVKETDSVYILTTDPQTPGEDYLLTVYNVRDQALNPV